MTEPRLGPGPHQYPTEEETTRAMQAILESLKRLDVEGHRAALTRIATAPYVMVETAVEMIYTHICKNCNAQESCPKGQNPFEHLMAFLTKHTECHLKS